MIECINQRIELSDGNRMPGYGFGCFKAQGAELLAAIQCAWNSGYRLFDTAMYYEQEDTVGEALAPYPVQEFFLISKIWPTVFDNPVKQLDISLKKLRRDYLDGYLLHWPGHDQKLRLNTWERLLREKEKGKIRTLGVSNFLPEHLEEIQVNFGHWPAINQIELHPVFQQKALCSFCRDKNIAIMAWSPIGRGDSLALPAIIDIAKAVGKTPAQVILRWQIQENRIPIPKSVHELRIRENAEVFNFTLTAEQIKTIDGLDNPEGGRRGPDPLVFP